MVINKMDTLSIRVVSISSIKHVMAMFDINDDVYRYILVKMVSNLFTLLDKFHNPKLYSLGLKYIYRMSWSHCDMCKQNTSSTSIIEMLEYYDNQQHVQWVHESCFLGLTNISICDITKDIRYLEILTKKQISLSYVLA